MSGYCATGSEIMQSTPANTINRAMTVANIGRFMKNFENIFLEFRYSGD